MADNNNINKTKTKKSKGWSFLFDVMSKGSSSSLIKYDNASIKKELPDLHSFNHFKFTLLSTGSISQEDIDVSQKILKICNLRDEYIKNFRDINISTIEDAAMSELDKKKNLYPFESAEPIYNPYNVPIIKKCNAFINFVEGIFYVHWDPHIDQGPKSKSECNESNKLEAHKSIITTDEYLSAIQFIMTATLDPACKSFCYQRLKYLEQKFDFHIMFNGSLELNEVKNIKHRDFYNTRKVDTHVHHSACMQQKALLRFIREKYTLESDTIVYADEDGEKMSLKQIFDKELKRSAYEATVDSLSVHALGNCFHRFDLFNKKYNPFGEKLLRDVFLKTDNYIKGRYLAEITKQEIEKLETSKYQHVEWRISIYGKSKDEWLKLAKWVLDNKVSSIRVRWVIQIPRLYHIYKKMKLINTFADFLRNVFEPCFEAVINPEQNKEIFTFLHQVVAWDSVDDESVISKYTQKGCELPTPENYVSDSNPPYSYYAYYMYINIRTLNELMVLRNLRPLVFRPHCGEIGNISHLACMFILADGINHGINLRKSPVLLYLYYLKQIGIAISPLSNNALFLQIEKNPFKTFFKIGLNVSLSTDDPLMFHFTDEPLLEEYSICAHIWNLSTVDLSEIAKNSVIQSGFEPAFKKHWLGVNADEALAFKNNPDKTNISNTRMAYRENTLNEENQNIKRFINYSKYFA